MKLFLFYQKHFSPLVEKFSIVIFIWIMPEFEIKEKYTWEI